MTTHKPTNEDNGQLVRTYLGWPSATSVADGMVIRITCAQPFNFSDYPETNKMATSSVQWQCTKTLPECLLRMLDEEIACDVTFLIGERAQEVKAHKIILMSRSPVFYSMLEGPLAEKGKITITDVDKESFIEFLRYLYTDKFKQNSNTVMGVLYCAKKYCVDNLSKVCSEFLKKNITIENVGIILGAAHRFDDKDIIEACISVVQACTAQFLKSPDFLEMSKECLGTVLDLDKADCSEEEIYKGVMRWAGEECRRQEMEVTPANCRAVLGDLIYKIRFATMDPIFFIKHISDSCFLSDHEKLDIYKFFHLKEDFPLTKFISSKRTHKPFKLNRFKDKRGYWTAGDFTDKISFEVSHDTILRGVQVYGCSERQTTVKYSICIKDSSGTIIYTGSESISTDSSTVTYDVLLTKAIVLKGREIYTVEMNQQPSPHGVMYFGKNGETSVSYDGNKTITFFSVKGSQHTNVREGQIPGLILS
ncbi:hypothetical protein FSP39_020117 [Pinctada imbricata]|uniref:BTB domain-containing protein n=1 Tax=Pinctada imbricata TaxID=66713 RepID=A0AA88YEP7_PINIB|nr:hypothetical protein FSP39_020117 [Pinctada imbricata]